MGTHPSARRLAYEMGKLDIKVGKILSCQVMDDNKACFISEVDVGEAKPRKIVSRATHLFSREKFFKRDERTVVCCNTKPVNVSGILSEGNFFYSHTLLDKVSHFYIYYII